MEARALKKSALNMTRWVGQPTATLRLTPQRLAPVSMFPSQTHRIADLRSNKRFIAPNAGIASVYHLHLPRDSIWLTV